MVNVELPINSQRLLIEIARQTLEDVVHRRLSKFSANHDPYLDESSYGAFVTLFKQGELRGCIGTCTPAHSLCATVVEMTEAAATRDPRVGPIRADELDSIHIDISVLSQLEAAEDPLALVVGQHGLYVQHERKRAVLLPQVAIEHDWDIQTFLQQTCAKANLPKEAWRWPDTVVSSFTALIIEEE